MQSKSKKSKRSYHKPKFSVYGSVDAFTQAAGGASSTPDGGFGQTTKTQ